jgi:hypothetical protein
MQNRPGSKNVCGCCAKTTLKMPDIHLTGHSDRSTDAAACGFSPELTRWRVCEGLSPNVLRYSTENRPNSTKPKDVAIFVTVTHPESADKSALLACDSRNIRRCRHGGKP